VLTLRAYTLTLLLLLLLSLHRYSGKVDVATACLQELYTAGGNQWAADMMLRYRRQQADKDTADAMYYKVKCDAPHVTRHFIKFLL
jgi:hypothetical protein